MVSLRRACAVVLATAMVTLGLAATAASAAASDPGGMVSCDYVFTEWPGGFQADVTLVNDGPEIDGWTVGLTFDDPATLVGPGWNADLSQPGPTGMIAENLSWNGVIPSGGVIAFGWVAFAVSHEVPAMAVNGAPC